MSRPISLSFSVSPQLLEELTLVTAEYAQGNRSEFLRLAIRHFASRAMNSRRADQRALSLKAQDHVTYSRDDVKALVQKIRSEKG
jgi:metal-responsive CopG/Arc/MetJ family transcriptional regulator